jgi:amidase
LLACLADPDIVDRFGLVSSSGDALRIPPMKGNRAPLPRLRSTSSAGGEEMKAHSMIASSAVALVAQLADGTLTPHDLLDALAERIRTVNGLVNALPTLCFERARQAADQLMRKPVRERGLLFGLPVPIKDLTAVAAVRTTFGSPIFAEFVPDASDVLVERLERSGGLVYAKSNTPEFGAGANTFNEVFGRTLNPYDTRLSAAGSSGGAAVALATGMAWIAHGSDMGGSLRYPASFCGVVGLRPSPGRVARTCVHSVDDTLAVDGPMARSVEDVALALDAMAGEDCRDPLSKPRPATSFLASARSGWRPQRVAYSTDLGITPVDPRVVRITTRAVQVLCAAGVVIEEAHPDFAGAHEAFQVLRAQRYAQSLGSLLHDHRDQLKPEVVWNIEKGFRLTVEEVAQAERLRCAIMTRTAAFFQTYDLLLCPATIVPPFPVGERYVAQCNGTSFATYVDWLAIAYAATLAGTPALSLPCGFTDEGLPIGLQVVAPVNGEARLLAGARWIEQVLALKTHVPIDPRSPVSVAPA